VQLALSFEQTTPQEVRIDHTIRENETQLWHNLIFHLCPDLQRVNCSLAPLGDRLAALLFADTYTMEFSVSHDFDP